MAEETRCPHLAQGLRDQWKDFHNSVTIVSVDNSPTAQRLQKEAELIAGAARLLADMAQEVADGAAAVCRGSSGDFVPDVREFGSAPFNAFEE